MENLVPTKMLSFNPNQLAIVRKTFGYTDVNKLEQDIDILDDWIRKQDHFVIKEFDRHYLERYLISNKGSIERAKQHFDRLCTLKNLMPEFLQGFDIKNEFKPLFNTLHVCFLPKPTQDNYRVAVVKVHGNDELVQLIHLYRYLVVLTEYVLTHDYCAGFEFIVDTRSIAYVLVMKLNPVIIRKAVTLIIEAMGLRLKKIHFISGSKFLDILIGIFKQGMTEKLSRRIEVHNNYESLYNHIQKEILPEEFGGNEKSIIELKDINFEEVSTNEHIERIKFIEKVKTDESLRLTWKFTEEYSGMPGSFKTLSVD